LQCATINLKEVMIDETLHNRKVLYADIKTFCAKRHALNLSLTVKMLKVIIAYLTLSVPVYME